MLSLILIDNQKHVSSIELYEKTGLRLDHYSDWWKRWGAANGTDGVDFRLVRIIRRGRHKKEYAVTLGLARELCFKANTIQSKKLRNWIMCEQKKVF